MQPVAATRLVNLMKLIPMVESIVLMWKKTAKLHVPI